MMTSTPTTELALMQRCRMIEGLSFLQLARHLSVLLPQSALRRKGWVGQAIECALGADAGTSAGPDFKQLQIELKTIPVNAAGDPLESTFLTHVPLLTIHQQQWLTSSCYAKLKRILWVPVEGERSIPYEERRIGRPMLWSPDQVQESILAQDWHELTGLIAMGHIDEIHAGIGEYLQIRPKAATGKSLCHAFDRAGNRIMTLPRGFYLRRVFTKQIGVCSQ